MAGKGKRRREKNYRAAHGGPSRLPPPPDHSKVDALPSKLRALMSLPTSSFQEAAKGSILKDAEGKRKRADGGDAEKRKREFEKEIRSESNELIEDGKDVPDGSQLTDSEGEIERSKDENKKKKRKRKQVTDLRFEKEILGLSSKRKERKKKYLEAKKNKHKKGKTEGHLEFAGREQVKFGDVVDAPPKLVMVPKAFKLKTAQHASKERLRLEAIEAYRNRKGWSSRPGGVELPPPVTS